MIGPCAAAMMIWASKDERTFATRAASFDGSAPRQGDRGDIEAVRPVELGDGVAHPVSAARSSISP